MNDSLMRSKFLWYMPCGEHLKSIDVAFEASGCVAALNSRHLNDAKSAAKASGSTTWAIALGSPSSAIRLLWLMLSPAMALMRPTVYEASRTASSVSLPMKPSSDVPPLCRLTLDVTATDCIFCSDSWVSMLNVRIESISSPKKSTRYGSSLE